MPEQPVGQEQSCHEARVGLNLLSLSEALYCACHMWGILLAVTAYPRYHHCHKQLRIYHQKYYCIKIGNDVSHFAVTVLVLMFHD